MKKVKLLPSEKFKSRKRISLIENGEIVKTKKRTAEVFNNLFRNIVKNLNIRSSRTEVFCKKGVLKSFPKFTGKHLCQSLFFNKIAA